jgi:flagellar motor component MotA
MKKIIITIFLFTTLTACQKNAEDKQEQMIKGVIDIHDEVMIKGDELMKLESKLDSAMKVSPDSLKVQKLYADLENASNQMSDWMNNYNPELVKGKSEEEISKYFADQKTKITEVKSLTNKSIEETNDFLGK